MEIIILLSYIIMFVISLLLYFDKNQNDEESNKKIELTEISSRVDYMVSVDVSHIDDAAKKDEYFSFMKEKIEQIVSDSSIVVPVEGDVLNIHSQIHQNSKED